MKITAYVVPRTILTTILALIALFAISASPVFAVPDPHLTGGSPITGFSGTPAPITDLQITGTGNPTVPVRLHVTNGTLTIVSTSGLSFTTNSAVTKEFTGPMAEVNTALATLTYTRTGTGTDTLEASLVSPGEVFFSGNNHVYEFVSFSATWVNANINALTRIKYGSPGYLTTIGSQAENDFVAARLLSAGWMGASDTAIEGDWKWVTGPEIGTSFWSGTSGGNTVGGQYANWGAGEPNNAGNEDCAQFLTGGTGEWNDLPCTTTTLPGYVVEYGSAVAPLDVSSVNVSLNTGAANATPTVATVGSAFVNGSTHTETAKPTLEFTSTDDDAGDTVQYQIQVDDTANFSSPVVDFTSALAVPGAAAFSVGQPTGTGTYTVGSAGQSLTNGPYYWRVRVIDNHTLASAYNTARSGGIAFIIAVADNIVAPVVAAIPPAPTTNAAPKTCSDTTSSAAPELAAIETTDTQAIVHFSAVDGNTMYAVSFGTTPAADQFTAQTPGSGNGLQTYTAINLAPGTAYYFKVRGISSCKEGDWSTVKQATTSVGSAIAQPSYQSQFQQTPTTVTVQPETTVPKPTAEPTGTPSAIPTVTPTPTSQPSPTPASPVANGTDGSGVVLEVSIVSETNQPVEGATVTLHSTVRETKTNNKGIAHFENVETGDHKVAVAYNGYNGEQALTVDGSQKLQTITLQIQMSKNDGLTNWIIGSLVVTILFMFYLLSRKRKRRHITVAG